jgi:hypothetical protein
LEAADSRIDGRLELCSATVPTDTTSPLKQGFSGPVPS